MKEYWFKRTVDGIVEGPCTGSQLKALAAQGIITAGSLITPDQQHWYPAPEVKGLFPEPEPQGPPTPDGMPAIHEVPVPHEPPVPQEATAEPWWPEPGAPAAPEAAEVPQAIPLPTAPQSAAPPPGPLTADGVTYARSGYAGMVGTTPGQDRDVGWFLTVSIIVLVLGVISFGVGFADGVRSASRSPYGPGPSPGAAGIQVFNCFVAAAAIGMWVYWLVWVYKVHAEMRDFTGRAYRISPGKALGFCFIPFFNLYWVVNMPYQLAKAVGGYLRQRGEVSPDAVLTFQILSIVPGSCISGLTLLFYALSMRSIQNGLNQLWAQTRRDLGAAETPVAF